MTEPRAAAINEFPRLAADNPEGTRLFALTSFVDPDYDAGNFLDANKYCLVAFSKPNSITTSIFLKKSSKLCVAVTNFQKIYYLTAILLTVTHQIVMRIIGTTQSQKIC